MPECPHHGESLVTIRQALDRLHLSRATLYALLAADHIQSCTVGPGGRARRVLSSSIDAYIARRLAVESERRSA
jgi:predicted DNA-binding transcriptional regulator AlpA